jgi:anti-sigma factor RsiW
MSKEVMTDKDLQNEWAWSQIEAYTDGSLEPSARERMLVELANDARLRAAVERAADVQHALRGMRGAPLPRGLRGKLLRIPGRPTMHWSWLAIPVTAAIAAIAIAPLLKSPELQPDPRVAALREFELAMTYVQKTAAIASHEVSGTVGGGVLDALRTSRDSLRDAESTQETGG